MDGKTGTKILGVVVIILLCASIVFQIVQAGRMRAHGTALDGIRADVSGLKGRSAAAPAIPSQVQDKLETITADCTSLQAQVKALTTRIEALDSESAAPDVDDDDRDDSVAAAAAEAKKALDDVGVLRKEIAALGAKIEALEKSCATREELQALTKEIAGISEKLAAKDDQRAEVKAELEALKQEITGFLKTAFYNTPW